MDNQSHRVWSLIFFCFSFDPFWFSYIELTTIDFLALLKVCNNFRLCNKTPVKKKGRSLEGELMIIDLTSQCQPPSPTAFWTTPWRPTRTDLVRLFPVTTTLVWRGRTVSSSSLLQSPKQFWSWENPLLRTFELSAASSICLLFTIREENRVF